MNEFNKLQDSFFTTSKPPKISQTNFMNLHLEYVSSPSITLKAYESRAVKTLAATGQSFDNLTSKDIQDAIFSDPEIMEEAFGKITSFI